MKRIDARQRLRAFVREQGSQRAAAKVLRMSPQHICDVLAGRRGMSTAMLTKLGLRVHHVIVEIQP